MSRTIFTAANLLDGEKPAQPDMTVVVNDGYIQDVRSGPVTTEPTDQLIDLAGKTLMPGMFVCHLHAEYRYLDLTRMNEIYIGVERPPGVLMAIAIATCKNLLDSGFTGYAGGACTDNIDAQLKMCIAEGIIEGPRILACSHHINSTGNDNDRAKWWYDMRNQGAEIFADGADAFRRAVRGEIKRGAEIIKIFPTGGHGLVEPKNVRGLAHDELIAVVQAAHERGAKVRAHCAWRDSILECINAGVDVIDHGDEVDEKIIELMAERGTFWTPSVVFLQALLAANSGQALEAQVAPIREDWNNVLRMIPIANEAGVNIVLGDDYGFGFMPHVPGIYAKEMSIYVREAGVDSLDTIRWATRNGAKLCNLEGLAGTVAAGAFADLLIVDGDPSTDIALLEEPGKHLVAVMKGGSFVNGILTCRKVTSVRGTVMGSLMPRLQRAADLRRSTQGEFDGERLGQVARHLCGLVRGTAISTSAAIGQRFGNASNRRRQRVQLRPCTA